MSEGDKCKEKNNNKKKRGKYSVRKVAILDEESRKGFTEKMAFQRKRQGSKPSNICIRAF